MLLNDVLFVSLAFNTAVAATYHGTVLSTELSTQFYTFNAANSTSNCSTQSSADKTTLGSA